MSTTKAEELVQPAPGGDSPEWTAERFKRSVRIDGLPPSLQAKLRAIQRNAKEGKVQLTINLSKDVAEGLEKYGEQWHEQADEMLREWLKKVAA